MDVLGTLRDEEHANTLRPNQPYDLLDLIEQPLARIVEDQMRLVEEEHELWLVNVASLHSMNVLNRSGLSCMSCSSRMLISPRPSRSTCIRSCRSNSGSPKNFSAPCCSSSTISRSRTPTVCLDIPP